MQIATPLQQPPSGSENLAYVWGGGAWLRGFVGMDICMVVQLTKVSGHYNIQGGHPSEVAYIVWMWRDDAPGAM